MTTPRPRSQGSALVVVVLLSCAIIPLLIALASMSSLQTRAAHKSRANLESRLLAEEKVVQLVSLLSQDHRQDHYSLDFLSGSSNCQMNKTSWLPGEKSRLYHTITVESKGTYGSASGVPMGHLGVIQLVSPYLRFGLVVNNSLTIDNTSPLAGATLTGGMWVLGDLRVQTPLSLSAGTLLARGDIQGNNQLTVQSPAQILYERTVSGVNGTASLNKFIPQDLQTMLPIGDLEDYYTRYDTTHTVVDATITFQSNGDVKFDRSGVISLFSVPANTPAVVVGYGATLALRGDIQRAYTVVAISSGATEGRVIVDGDLTYQGDPSKNATLHGTLAVLAERITFEHPTAGSTVRASGFFYGRTAVEVRSPTNLRGVLFSENGNISTPNGSRLNITYDLALTTGTPRFLAEQPEIVRFELRKPTF